MVEQCEGAVQRVGSTGACQGEHAGSRTGAAERSCVSVAHVLVYSGWRGHTSGAGRGAQQGCLLPYRRRSAGPPIVVWQAACPRHGRYSGTAEGGLMRSSSEGSTRLMPLDTASSASSSTVSPACTPSPAR